MIPLVICFGIMTMVSGNLGNNLGRYDEDYVENGYLRSGKKYSPNMHSYRAGGEYNERYADSDRYIARNLQKAPDYKRDNDDDRSGAYTYGGGNWMGQHYPVKNTASYIKPTYPACTLPSCVTVSASTTISRLVSICQLPITYLYTGVQVSNTGTVTLYSADTGTCTLVGLPSKLVPDCCSGSSTASSSEPCLTSTFVRTILKDKTCTINFETFLYIKAEFDDFLGHFTSDNEAPSTSYTIVATTCAL